MKAAIKLLTLLYIYSVLVEASFIPTSISEAASGIKDHGWRRKKKAKQHPEDEAYPKYFHEPDGNQALHHYDARYHHGVLAFDDKTDTQIHLIRSYFEYFRQNQMETWIAHGTLLGWWWNGKLLPWDWDIDTQVSIATMLYLAENHNNTKYTYTSTTDTEFDPATSTRKPVSRKYQMDVNPAVYTRHRNEGDNIIDARWIDVRNGLYIDVTALAETHPNDNPGVWLCKNYHRYRTRDLWPMRETNFEGVTAKVPFAYARILSEEYGAKALVVDDYQGHRWSVPDHVWVRKSPKEIEQDSRDRHSVRRKKQEEKAERLKEDNEAEMAKLFDQDQEEREREKKEREGRLKEFNEPSENAAQLDDSSKDRMREKRAFMQEDVGWRNLLQSKHVRRKHFKNVA